MKKNFLILTSLISILCLSGCGNKTFPEEDDGYVDKLPETNEHGPILQAFNWTFNQVKENLPAIKNSGFKVVQISPVTPSKNGGTTWWSFYQPLGFMIAESSPLGTKNELKEMCEEADKQGIDIIADVVFNHLANTTDKDYEADGTPKVSPQVAQYEPIIYNSRNENFDGVGVTFHHIKPATGSGSETQYYPYGDLPDLNTGNSYVQGRCLQFLKDCIDIGIDGFRFDAAKHIETPEDPQYASSFWPNTLGKAREYYSNKFNGKNLYAYGEVLGDPIGRDISTYTKLMNVAEDNYNSKAYNCMRNRNFTPLTSSHPYGKVVENNSSLVVWDESHDDVVNNSNLLPDKTTIQKYALIAANKDITPMFLARPNANAEVGTIGNYTFESENIAVINRFANRYKNATEYLSAPDKFFVNEKIQDENDGGALIFAYGENGNSYEIPVPHLKEGNYYNQFDGKMYTVINGKVKVEFDANGIIILTKTKNPLRPVISIDHRGGTFAGELTINISIKNASKSTYKINTNNEVEFNKTISLKLNKSLCDANKEIKLVIKANNDKYVKEATYNFKVIDLIADYFNVINFDSSILDNYSLYEWAWKNGTPGKWIKVHHLEGNTLLCDFKDTSYTSFLLAKFPKDYVIKNVDAWDDKCVSQTTDIEISKGFFDAKGF